MYDTIPLEFLEAETHRFLRDLGWIRTSLSRENQLYEPPRDTAFPMLRDERAIDRLSELSEKDLGWMRKDVHVDYMAFSHPTGSSLWLSSTLLVLVQYRCPVRPYQLSLNL